MKHGVPDFGLFIGAQVDQLGVASGFKVGDAIVAPAVLVVAQQCSPWVCREARFAGAREPEQQSDADILAQMKATNPALESYGTRADYEQEFVIGTPDQVAERLREYADLGAAHFMLWFMDYPDLEGLRLFAREVMPGFR